MNLVEKLKNVPAGTKLYSPVFKDPVEFLRITPNSRYPIEIKTSTGECHRFTEEGYYTNSTSPQNCMLFPTPKMTWDNINYIRNEQLVAWSIEGEIIQVACIKGGFYDNSVDYYWFYSIESDKVITNSSMIYNEILDEQSTPIVKNIIKSKGYIIDGTNIIQYKFKKGDIIVTDTGIIALFDSIENRSRPDTIVYQAILRTYGGLKIATDVGIGYASNATLASKEEKERFFNALSKAGYYWNGEKIVPIFKKGDIVVSTGGCIAIVDHIADLGTSKNVIYYQACINFYGHLKMGIDCGVGNTENNRNATNGEKARILRMLAEAGYEFDGVSVKRKEYQFEPFEQVLVRDSANEKWKTAHYSHREGMTYIAGGTWLYCIPYNDETKHLRGTSLDAPKKYK